LRTRTSRTWQAGTRRARPNIITQAAIPTARRIGTTPKLHSVAGQLLSQAA
jgi:hypothetical protein